MSALHVFVLDSMYLHLVLSLLVWGYRTLLCCRARPPQGRRDPLGAGGRHRGQAQGGTHVYSAAI